MTDATLDLDDVSGLVDATSAETVYARGLDDSAGSTDTKSLLLSVSLTDSVGRSDPTPTFARGVEIVGAPATIAVAAPTGTVTGTTIDRSDAVLTLVLPTPTVPVQPGLLRVLVSGGEPADAVYFWYDAVAYPEASTTLTDLGGQELFLGINAFTVASHTVRVGTSLTVAPTPSVANTGTFDVTGAPLPGGSGSSGQLPDVAVPTLVNHWVFQAYDFSSLDSVDSYEFPVNPDQVQMTLGGIVINSEPTTVSSGEVISWEGAPAVQQMTWGGRILSEEQHDALYDWGVTGQRVYITDHLHRRYLVKIVSLDVTRVRDVNRPWHHEYTFTASLLAGPGVNGADSTLGATAIADGPA